VVNIGELAASSEKGDGGSIRMTADGQVTASGKIEAKGAAKGGQIDISGQAKTEIAAAKIEADGDEGGLIRVGGEFQGGQDDKTPYAYRADFVDRFGALPALSSSSEVTVDGFSSVNAGPDGTLIVWSDGVTSIEGALTGKFLETSGHSLRLPKNPGLISASHWLIDPTNVTVTAGDDPFSFEAPGDTTVGAGWISSQSGGLISISASDTLTIAADISASSALQFSAGTNLTIVSSIGIYLIGGSSLYSDYNLNINNFVTINSTGSLLLSANNILIGNNNLIEANHSSNDYDSLTINSKNIQIGDTNRIQMNGGELIFLGQNIIIGEKNNLIANGNYDKAYGRINFWGLDSPNYNNYNSINKPFESIILKSGSLMKAEVGIDIYTKSLELIGASLLIPESTAGEYLTVAESRIGYIADDGDESYIFNPGNSILKLTDDINSNISKIINLNSSDESGIDLSVSQIIFSNTQGTRINGSHVFLTGPTNNIFEIPAGSLTVPLIRSDAIYFSGNGTTYKIGNYAVKTRFISADEDVYITNLNSSNVNGPHIFGLDEQYSVIFDSMYIDDSWNSYIDFLANEFKQKNSSIVLGDSQGDIWVGVPSDATGYNLTISSLASSVSFSIDSQGRITYNYLDSDININIDDLLSAITSSTANGFFIHSDGDLILESMLVVSKAAGLGFEASGNILLNSGVGLTQSGNLLLMSAGDITINGGIVLMSGQAVIEADGNVNINSSIYYRSDDPNIGLDISAKDLIFSENSKIDGKFNKLNIESNKINLKI
jgi:hypothetical protein